MLFRETSSLGQRIQTGCFCFPRTESLLPSIERVYLDGINLDSCLKCFVGHLLDAEMLITCFLALDDQLPVQYQSSMNYKLVKMLAAQSPFA